MTARATPDGLCTVPDCTRTHLARGYCDPHLRRWRKYGDPLHGGPLRAVGGARPAEHVAEDVEWLLGTDAPESIARRVGYRSIEYLAISLRDRCGRPDLADRLVRTP